MLLQVLVYSILSIELCLNINSFFWFMHFYIFAMSNQLFHVLTNGIKARP